MNTYHPTLWRTCRVLANTQRLQCLKLVLSEPMLTVGDVADRTGHHENRTSEYLRALQARGLVRACRQSRWVRYTPHPDPLVPHGKPLLSALRQALIKNQQSERNVIRTLTAFTHPRRLSILSHLQKHGSVAFERLSVATSVSPQALYRHLKKLKTRGLIASNNQCWRLTPPSDDLAKTLLILLAQEEAFLTPPEV